MQQLQNPILIAATFILVFFAARALAGFFKQAMKDSAERNSANIETVARLARSQEELAQMVAHAGLVFNNCVTDLTKSLAQTKEAEEKVMAGVTKACEAIAIATDRHREAVSQFSKTLIGPTAERDMLEQPSDTTKDLVFGEMQYRAAGQTPERARELAELDEMKAANSYPTA